jgi:hypothetical protein
MPKPKKSLISLDTIPYYHFASRCVHRAYLCGTETITGINFEQLTQLFPRGFDAYRL